MTEAWQVRNYERDTLMAELMNILYKEEYKEEHRDEFFFFKLASGMVDYLKEQEKAQWRPAAMGAETFFYEHILPKIVTFARTEAESDVLVANLLKKVLDSGLGHFYSELSKQEIAEPETIFKASSAMEDI